MSTGFVSFFLCFLSTFKNVFMYFKNREAAVLFCRILSPRVKHFANLVWSVYYPIHLHPFPPEKRPDCPGTGQGMGVCQAQAGEGLRGDSCVSWRSWKTSAWSQEEAWGREMAARRDRTSCHCRLVQCWYIPTPRELETLGKEELERDGPEKVLLICLCSRCYHCCWSKGRRGPGQPWAHDWAASAHHVGPNSNGVQKGFSPVSWKIQLFSHWIIWKDKL